MMVSLTETTESGFSFQSLEAIDYQGKETQVLGPALIPMMSFTLGKSFFFSKLHFLHL